MELNSIRRSCHDLISDDGPDFAELAEILKSRRRDIGLFEEEIEKLVDKVVEE